MDSDSSRIFGIFTDMRLRWCKEEGDALASRGNSSEHGRCRPVPEVTTSGECRRTGGARGYGVKRGSVSFISVSGP